MSHVIKLCSSSLQILRRRESRRVELSVFGSSPNAIIRSKKTGRIRLIGSENFQSSNLLAYNNSEEGSVQSLDNSPISIELGSILSETQFDRVMAEAQQLEEPVVIIWMATWCRKCIYLKPKLEKLAAEYFPRIRFFHIDVNNVSHKLVVRAGVTKMPTIQLWKDGKKQEEVIGGHKAHLVVNEVREMIENECAL